MGATELAAAQADTIRLRLLKIGGQVRGSVRKVWVQMASSYPYQALFSAVFLPFAADSYGPIRATILGPLGFSFLGLAET